MESMAVPAPARLNADVDELLTAAADLPYSLCPLLEGESHAAYLKAALREAEAGGHWVRTHWEAGRATEIIHLQPQPWDSQQFGFPVARIAHWVRNSGRQISGLLETAIEAARAQGTRYLWLRIPAADVNAARILREQQFDLIDGLITFGAAPQRMPASQPPIGCRPHRPSDLPALRQIAAASFTLGRFHDPALPPGTAAHAYRDWVENCCTGTMAECVLVAGDSDVAGFTTVNIDRLAERALRARIAVIGLVATSASHRGKGIARSLALATLQWCREQGCAWVEVGTQMGNIAACRLYEAAGYRMVAASLTFRKLL